ncbi:hypothetical protein E2C01_007245 [Portunus trituberculatus]|uniref:Uncharacterized protein n=1 Tax=Portunus trituberculatus TaxID=210409 RepID=A0A5B7CYX4_PORTR|nr:hypothetical protein [Portunus trituberculatus]
MRARERVIKGGDSWRKETLVPLFFTSISSFLFAPLLFLLPPLPSLLTLPPRFFPLRSSRCGKTAKGGLWRRQGEREALDNKHISGTIPASASPRRDKASDVPIRLDSPKLQCPIQFQGPQAPPHLNNCGGGAAVPGRPTHSA